MTSIDEIKPAAGGRWVKWYNALTEEGVKEITGQVIAYEKRQQVDFDTKAPLTWSDGKPRMESIFRLQTDERANEDDDGVRILQARGGNYTVARGTGEALEVAIFEAYKAAGIKTIEGAHLTVKLTGKGEATKGNPPNLYTAKATPGVLATPVPTDDDEPF
jgi:hypothetical protein